MLTTAQIRTKMKRLGILNAGLAYRAGLSQCYVSQLLNGTRPMSKSAAKKIADALKGQP